MKRMYLPLLFSLVATEALAGNQRLVVCTQAAPEGFDIVQYASAYTADASAEPLFNRLVEFAPGTTDLIPGLAEDWKISDDGLTYTFNLRPSVKFHSTAWFTPSREFNADDVVWSFLRAHDRKHPWHDTATRGYAYFEGMSMRELIQSVEKVDDMTVRFTLTRPETPFLANMAMAFASIYSAEYGDQLLAAGKTNQLNHQPIGTGPFIFERYAKDTQIRYRANPDYFRGSPKIDTLIFAITTDANTRLQKLRAGECHVADNPKVEDLSVIRANPALALDEIDAMITSYMVINTQRKPLDDVRVRQAINMAVDKHALIRTLYGENQVTVAVNPYPPTLLGYNHAIEEWPYDPARARALLDEAGVSDLQLDLFISKGSGTINPATVAQFVQEDLNKVGIKVNIRAYEWGEMLKRTKSGEHHMMTISWIGDNGDPDNFLTPNLSCSAAQTGENQARWCHPEFERLIREARTLEDPEQRAERYGRAQEVFHQQAPWVPLSHPRHRVARRSNVQGYVISPLGGSNYANVEVQ